MFLPLQKNKDNMKNVEEKAAQMVAAAQVITVASIDENGYPRPVAMSKLKDEDGAIYVSTGTSSAKTLHFKANPKAGVSIVEGGNSIVYTGEIGWQSISLAEWKTRNIACLNLRRNRLLIGLMASL